MHKLSAGFLMYRWRGGTVEVFLVHPGGPYWANKDFGSWSVPKGEPGPEEDLLAAAQREFEEETGIVPSGNFIPLSPVKQPGGKIVHAWAFEGDCDPASVRSNTVELEWPPRSGKTLEFPEIDRAAWFGLEDAGKRITKGQKALLEELRFLLLKDMLK